MLRGYSVSVEQHRPNHPIDAKKVADARAHAVLPDAAVREMVRLFSLLSDPLRVQITSTLARAGELCVTDIAMAIGTSDNRVSYGLRQMRQAGVVDNRRAGREVFYRLVDRRLERLLANAHLPGGPAD